MFQINDIESVRGLKDDLPSGYSCIGGSSLCLPSSNVTQIREEHIYVASKNVSSDSEYRAAYNGVKIKPNGDVTITYQYGYTEALITYEKCTDVIEQDNKACSGADKFSVDKVVIYYGAINRSSSPVSKTFSSSKYYSEGDIIRISVIIDFMTEAQEQDDDGTYQYTGQYSPQFCTISYGGQSCTESVTNRVISYEKEMSITLCEKYDKNKTCTQKDYVVTKGDTTTPRIYKGSLSGSNTYNKAFVATNIVAEVDSDDASSGVSQLISETIIPVLLAVLGVLALVTSVTLGYQIVKSADEPELRSEKIKKLRNILIGLAAVAIVLIAYEPAYEFAKKLITNQQSGK